LVQPAFGLRLGGTVDLGEGQPFTIVGTLDDSTMLGGIPNVFISVDDLQKVAFKGAPVITSVAVTGTPGQVPGDLKVVSRPDAHSDLIRPLGSAKNTIFTMSILLWVVAGCIIGSVIYISALERLRDFAVFKAIGISTGWVFGGLIIQAVALSLVSSAAAIGLGFLLAPRLSVPVTLPVAVIALVPITAIVVSVLGTLAGASRAVRVDPALAFG